MPYRALVLVLSVGVLAIGCGHAPPPTPASRLAPGMIVWPSTLDHPSTPETHREAALQLLTEAGVKAAMVALTEVMLRQQIELKPVLKPYEGVLREFFARYASFEALRDDFAKLYTDRFDELQLRQLIAFYQTPTGRLAVHKIPEIVQVGAELGKRNVEKHAPELRQMLMQHDPPKP